MRRIRHHLLAAILATTACGDKDDGSGGPGTTDDTGPGPDSGDGGGAGDSGDPMPADADGDGHDETVDCDDTDPDVHPDATEWCNGNDDDCDGQTDESDAADAATWYPDADGDTFGNPDGTAVVACDQPAEHAGTPGDCDDTDAAVNPDAEEVCDNGQDDDCDGTDNGCGLWGEVEIEEVADATFVGETGDSWLGHPMASGDLDDDGYSDVVLSAGMYEEPGLAYVLYGPLSSGEYSVAIADVRWTGDPVWGDSMGWAVAAGDDLNADGIPDLVLADRGYDNGTDVADGAVYLVYGATSGVGSSGEIPTNGAVLTNAHAERNMARHVAMVGDTDGDGVDDLLLSAEHEDDEPGTCAWLFTGPLDAGNWNTDDASATVDGDDGDPSHCGDRNSAMSSAGDVNDDGLADLLIGDSANEAAGDNAGRAYVFFGNSTAGDMALSGAPVRIEGHAGGGQDHDHAGINVAGGGDANGDGVGDFAVVAETSSAGGAYATGRVSVFFGPVATGTLTMDDGDAIIVGSEEFESIGMSAVSFVGDLSRTGTDTLAIGSCYWEQRDGRMPLWYGPLTTGQSDVDAADAIVVGSSQGKLCSAQAAGDTNGDGTPDILLGESSWSDDAPYYDDVYGRVHLVVGHSW